MRLERILVPTDFSEDARRALELAVEWAKHFGASIEVLHAYAVPADIYPYALYITDEMLAGIHAKQKERVEGLCTPVRDAGVPVTAYAERGATHDVIPRFAEEHRVDLIVVGTRGHTGLKHLFLGSTAERTIQLAPCPVVAVRGESRTG